METYPTSPVSEIHISSQARQLISSVWCLIRMDFHPACLALGVRELFLWIKPTGWSSHRELMLFRGFYPSTHQLSACKSTRPIEVRSSPYSVRHSEQPVSIPAWAHRGASKVKTALLSSERWFYKRRLVRHQRWIC